ncbi:MAG: DUF202 domain-containing protein [Planctomycetota bacterium]|jgi:putative membrane protein|nr:DUF202 domain-containing protein [Planctomycetota bacterium]
MILGFFYAIERTLLAWMRTEIAILAFAFLIKKFGIEAAAASRLGSYLDAGLYFLCGMVVLMSVLSLIQCHVSISKLGEQELPSRASKSVVLFTGFVGIVLCLVSGVAIIAV